MRFRQPRVENAHPGGCHTHTREVATLRIGHFIAHETQTHCSHCADQSVFFSEELQQLVPPGARYGYDVIVSVGQAIFLQAVYRLSGIGT